MSKRTTLFLLVALIFANVVAWGVPNTLARRGTFNQLDLLVDVRHQLLQWYVEEPDDQRMVEAAVKAMVESLDDPFTTYLPLEEFQAFDRAVRGTFSGIGAEVDIHERRLRIVSPLEDSPAWKAGIMAGDVVLEIDGENTIDMSLTDAISRLTGEPNTDVTLLVRHKSGVEQAITITRAQINVPTVRGFERGDNGSWIYFINPTEKIAYVRLSQFTGRSADDFEAICRQLAEQDVRGLIVDLRFNPGGLLDAAVRISDVFLTEGQRIVSVNGRSVAEVVQSSTEKTILPDIPVVLIANESSASASEVVAGALLDNNRAQLIGTRTFGKGSVQQVLRLSDNLGALKITNAYYYLPNGRNIHRRTGSETWGVDPADGYFVPMSPSEIQKMLEIRRDEQTRDITRDKLAENAVTSEWIEQTLADPQLAAALRAVTGKLRDDSWPVVGSDDADHYAELVAVEALERQRASLEERIAELDAEINRKKSGVTQPR